MKSRLYLILMILVLAGPSFTQKIGFNINTPVHPLHVVQPAGTTINSFQPLFYTEYTGTNLADVIGIKAKSKPADYYGIGGDFEGGYTGVRGRVTGGLNQDYYGVSGDVSGTGAGDFFGVYGNAHTSGSGHNYGIYGTATGGFRNWAGYFDSGNVYIENHLCIGTEETFYPLQVYSNQAVASLVSTTSTSGSYLILRNDASSPTTLGTIDFRTNTSLEGQIAYTANNDFIFRTNETEKFRITEVGRVGIGRVPTLFMLEVEGAASKASAGDWIANSDERLKKNIQPLEAEEMIEKLLALQGVTYEWNDDKTGTKRPEGIQYGFIAQNIQKSFPTLVEEDTNGFLVTAYGTYDAMMVEAIRYLYKENQSLRNDLEEIRNLIKGETAGK